MIYEGNEGARYFDSGAFASPGAGQYGNAPRTIGDARYQFRKNIDLVIAKDTTLFGNHVAQVRFEILNLTNTAKFRGIDSQLRRLDHLRADHAAGRIHADLAAELPLHVLIAEQRLAARG